MHRLKGWYVPTCSPHRVTRLSSTCDVLALMAATDQHWCPSPCMVKTWSNEGNRLPKPLLRQKRFCKHILTLHSRHAVRQKCWHMNPRSQRWVSVAPHAHLSQSELSCTIWLNDASLSTNYPPNAGDPLLSGIWHHCSGLKIYAEHGFAKIFRGHSQCWLDMCEVMLAWREDAAFKNSFLCAHPVILSE